MPNLVKVGYSTKDPHLRVEELSGTGLPHPFEVEYDALVFDPRDVEQAVHAELRGEHEAKEFYRVSVSEAVRTIRQIVKVQQKQVIAEHIRTPEPEWTYADLYEQRDKSKCQVCHSSIKKGDKRCPKCFALLP